MKNGHGAHSIIMGWDFLTLSCAVLNEKRARSPFNGYGLMLFGHSKRDIL